MDEHDSLGDGCMHLLLTSVERGLHIVAYDSAGCGRSDHRVQSGYSVFEMPGEVLQIVNALEWQYDHHSPFIIMILIRASPPLFAGPLE